MSASQQVHRLCPLNFFCHNSDKCFCQFKFLDFSIQYNFLSVFFLLFSVLFFACANIFGKNAFSISAATAQS